MRCRNLPYVGLGVVSLFVDDLRCHPVWRAPHGPQYQRTGTNYERTDGAVRGHVETELLGAAEVDQFDDAVWHQHHVAALNVAETHATNNSVTLTPCDRLSSA